MPAWPDSLVSELLCNQKNKFERPLPGGSLVHVDAVPADGGDRTALEHGLPDLDSPEPGRAPRSGDRVPPKGLDAPNVLPLLERKHRAVAEATAFLDWQLAPVLQQARAELAKHTRKPDQEWVRMLRPMETHPAAAVEYTVRAALDRHSPRLETVPLILRQQETGPPPVCPPVTGVRPELARMAVPAPTLSAYDALVEGAR